MPSVRIPKNLSACRFFITITTVEWIELFSDENYCDILIEALKFHQINSALKLNAYVIMSNHIHFIGISKNMIQVVQSLKSHTTQRLKKLLEKENRVDILKLFYKKNGFRIWQHTNMPKVIESEYFYRQKLNYIHNNPVKKGLVSRPED